MSASESSSGHHFLCDTMMPERVGIWEFVGVLTCVAPINSGSREKHLSVSLDSASQ